MKSLLTATILVAVASGLGWAGTKDAHTWTRDVGPLMAKKCMNCHRPGEVAPMSLLSYEEARPWAWSIKEEVERRVMPPWHADPAYGRFGNDRRLTDDEIQTIVDWVDEGAPRGDGDFAAPTFPEGWLLGGELGEPDYVFQMEEEFVIPASGPDINVDIEVPMDNLKEDIWVQAAEVRGNSRVVHHNVVAIIQPDGKYDPTGRLASAVPGKQWDHFSAGAGKLVRQGSRLRFGLHYHPNGREEKDRSRVGVWLARNPIAYRVHSAVVADPALEIPPHEPNYESLGEFIFEVDAEITLFKPHMHYRGKDMLYKAVYPDGREEILCSVPEYDMNWQISYELAQPLPVPKGTELKVVAHFDNSENNRWNPDPSVRVIWGSDSRDEMMEGWFDYRVKMEKPVIPAQAEPTAAPAQKTKQNR
jgi:hypothetical protein